MPYLLIIFFFRKLKSHSQPATEEKASPTHYTSIQFYNSENYLNNSNQFYLNEYLRTTASLAPSLFQNDPKPANRIDLENSQLSKAFSFMKKKMNFSNKEDSITEQTFYENLMVNQQSAENNYLEDIKNSKITSSSVIIFK